MKPKRQSKWIRLAILILVWLIIWSLFKDLNRVKRGFTRIDEAKQGLTEAEQKNKDLKEKMDQVQTDYYKEKVIRDKLNMQLPGETVVVLPDSQAETEESNPVGIASEANNWEKWWQVIK